MLNAMLLKKIWLKKEEAPILVIRSSLLHWLRPLILSALFFFGAFFLMSYLWQYGSRGLLIFFLLIVLALVVFSRALYEYYFTCWILTNLRLIDLYQRGFFHREMSAVIYNKLQDVNARKASLICSLFNLGDIYAAIIGSRVKLKLGRVRGYDRAISEIILQQENYQKNLLDEKERRAQYLLIKIKNKVGADAFRKLLGD